MINQKHSVTQYFNNPIAVGLIEQLGLKDADVVSHDISSTL
ncbi:hypothetical protein [Vibrio aestuarianus]|nr:hypothetical protein [Vibrio aestuarianus]